MAKTTESFWSSGYKKLIIVTGCRKRTASRTAASAGSLTARVSLEAWTRHDYTTSGVRRVRSSPSVALDPHVRTS